MKANVGLADRVIRIILAIVIGILYFTHVITGTLGIILLILGIVFLITALVSVCPIYLAVGMSTKGKKE
jgi:hypothetical protein